jgi:hypothetical protein
MALLLVWSRMKPSSCWPKRRRFWKPKSGKRLPKAGIPKIKVPIPDDWDEMMEKYQEASGDQSYFGDWTYTVIDAALCEPAHEKD